MPQSAQNLFAGWFNKHSNNSLALAGSVSVNHHNHMEPRSHYQQERMNQTLAVKQQRKLCQQLHLSIIYHIKLFSLISLPTCELLVLQIEWHWHYMNSTDTRCKRIRHWNQWIQQNEGKRTVRFSKTNFNKMYPPAECNDKFHKFRINGACMLYNLNSYHFHKCILEKKYHFHKLLTLKRSWRIHKDIQECKSGRGRYQGKIRTWCIRAIICIIFGFKSIAIPSREREAKHQIAYPMETEGEMRNITREIE